MLVNPLQPNMMGGGYNNGQALPYNNPYSAGAGAGAALPGYSPLGMGGFGMSQMYGGMYPAAQPGYYGSYGTSPYGAAAAFGANPYQYGFGANGFGASPFRAGAFGANPYGAAPFGASFLGQRMKK